MLAGCYLASCNQSPNPSSQNDLEQIRKEKPDPHLVEGTANNFAANAAIGSMMEIESSALMIKRTENRDIQNLATVMVKDHLMAQKELKEIALKENLSLPQSLPPEKLLILSKLDSLKDDERNHYYAELMVMEHEDAVRLFRNAGKNDANASLADFARAKLPILEHHLMEANHVFKMMRNNRGDQTGISPRTTGDKSKQK